MESKQLLERAELALRGDPTFKQLHSDLRTFLFPKENMPWEQRLADWLHDKHCHGNHTDGCGWLYENDWSGSAHKSWLKQAKESIEGQALTEIFRLDSRHPILVEAGLVYIDNYSL